MKKFTALLTLVTVISLSFCACGGNEPGTAAESGSPAVDTSPAVTVTSPDETETAALLEESETLPDETGTLPDSDITESQLPTEIFIREAEEGEDFIFREEQSDYSADFALSFSTDVTGLEIYKFEWSADDDGGFTYACETIFEADGVEKDTEVCISVMIPGDNPSRGFSFVDFAGERKYFEIGISGFDGSLFISELPAEDIVF